MGIGSGNGKSILFGEHFVVHGANAIAGAITNKVIVKIKQAKKNSVRSNYEIIEKMSLDGVQNILNSMNVIDKYEIEIDGDLPTYGGLGSSAAFCVALTKAIANDKNIHLNESQINAHAYEGERAFHGNPSGVDNFISTHGGIYEFKRGKTQKENQFGKIEIKKPLTLVISFSGKYGATMKTVSEVRKLKEDDEEKFSQIMDEYSQIEEEAKKMLEKGKIDEIGKLMNSNQSLLKEIGVCDELNDKAINIALKHGAIGAKITGGGGGGCSIALVEDEKNAIDLNKKLNDAGFKSFVTKVG